MKYMKYVKTALCYLAGLAITSSTIVLIVSLSGVGFEPLPCLSSLSLVTLVFGVLFGAIIAKVVNL